MTVEKDVASCIHALLDTHVLDSSDNSISCVSAQHPKAMKTQQLHEIVVSALESTTTSDTSHVALLEHGSSNINVESALSNLLATSGENDVIVVCGTAYMISDAISTLKQHNCVEISPTMEVDVDQELQAQEKTWYDAL